eukprot:39750-Eustigmatos_ZCMA.PRE.1
MTLDDYPLLGRTICLTCGFATRRCRHFMSLGGVENLEEAEGWARIAVSRLECLESDKFTRWVCGAGKLPAA